MSVVEIPQGRHPGPEIAEPPAPPRGYPGGRSARAWRWTAASGVALVVFATVHLIAQHFIVHGTGGLRTYHQVLHYIANPVMFVTECGLLLAVTIHAMLGVRSVLHDLTLRPSSKRRIDRVLWVVGTVTVAYGLALLITLASRA